MKTKTEEAFAKAVEDGKTYSTWMSLGKCCDKAVGYREFCVCAYRTICPEHGRKCWGTHD